MAPGPAIARRILVTGAAGGVARLLRPRLRARYGDVVLTDRVPIGDVTAGETFRRGDLADAGFAAEVAAGADAVVHLAGQSSEASWEVIKRANLDGLHNVLEACLARDAGRFVFASSCHVFGMYPASGVVGPGERFRPDSRYAASKVMGEAMCSLYARKHGLACLAIRIGLAAEACPHPRFDEIWIHPDDLFQLVTMGIEHPDIEDEVVFGVSDPESGWWDNDRATALGYRPAHKIARSRPDATEGMATIAGRLRGREFAADGYTADRKRGGT